MSVPTLADARAERAAIAAAPCHVSRMLVGRQNGEGQGRGTPAIQPLTAEIQLPTAENQQNGNPLGLTAKLQV